MTDSDQQQTATGWEAEPVDPDTADAPWPTAARGNAPRREQGQVLGVIAVGGVVGAAARYGASLLWPTPADHFPWTTFWVNVVGCGLMGILMVLVTEKFSAHPLIRPLLGTGVLGGFTTFSTYTVDATNLLQPQTSGTALLYLMVTLLGALGAIWLTATLTRFAALGPTGSRR